jgi:DNA/RNA-binding domain of Phe-tRNA-synthetase-like protein
MVTTATTRGLLVVFAPREIDAARLTRIIDVTSERMQQYTGCVEAGRYQPD